MSKAVPFKFELFAQEFVRKYWETVKNGEFSMSPDEPVEETIEELLSRISHETEFERSASRTKPLHKLRMMDTYGSWWLFTFRENAGKWALVGCSARSDDEENPHDLLGPVYSRDFAPFLRHVIEAANTQKNI